MLRSSGLRLTGVLPPVPAVDEQQQNQTQSVTDQDGDLSRYIPRSCLRGERVRTNYIAHTVADKVQCCDAGLLGTARDVGGDQTQHGSVRRWCSLCEVVADESTDLHVQRKGDDQYDAEECNTHGNASNQDTALQPAADPAVGPTGNDDHRTTGDPEEQCLQVAIAEADDKLAEKIGQAAVGDVVENPVEKKCPEVRVNEDFTQLIPLELFVADTLLVFLYALDGQQAFALV